MRSLWVRNNALVKTEEGTTITLKFLVDQFCPKLFKKQTNKLCNAMLLIPNGDKV